MPPFDQIRSVIAAWRAWRWKRLVGPIVDEISRIAEERALAARQHRSVRTLDARIRSLKIRQLKLEMSL